MVPISRIRYRGCEEVRPGVPELAVCQLLENYHCVKMRVLHSSAAGILVQLAPGFFHELEQSWISRDDGHGIALSWFCCTYVPKVGTTALCLF